MIQTPVNNATSISLSTWIHPFPTIISLGADIQRTTPTISPRISEAMRSGMCCAFALVASCSDSHSYEMKCQVSSVANPGPIKHRRTYTLTNANGHADIWLPKCMPYHSSYPKDEFCTQAVQTLALTTPSTMVSDLLSCSPQEDHF